MNEPKEKEIKKAQTESIIEKKQKKKKKRMKDASMDGFFVVL